MATFDEHLKQAVKNISILEQVSGRIADSEDWQVTIVFYSALHLANAHIAKTTNQHYRSHAKVSEVLNPYCSTNVSAFDEDAYDAYSALQGLSRRSRYLISDNKEVVGENAYFTSEKHLAKALRHLDCIQQFFAKKHKCRFVTIKINYSRIKSDKLVYIVAE